MMANKNSPATSPEIHIAMCVDRSFTLPLAVALASIDHVTAQDLTTVHVAHPGFSQATRDRVTRHLSTINVIWYELDEDVLAGAHYTTTLSPASLYRLLLGRILPTEVTRVLYLDADTVTLSSLAAVYAADLNGAVVGAVRDAGSPWAASAHGRPWRLFGLSPSSAYFNSGVILIDLDSWRAESVGDKCLRFLRHTSARWGDQDALNVVLEGRWHEMSRRWNLQTADLGDHSLAWVYWAQDIDDAIRNPSIVHFTDSDKPWTAGSGHPLASEWFEALDRTDWSGWRPKASRGYRVAQRAAAVLRSVRDSQARRRHRLPE